jgi:hypothetical protein
MSVTACTFLDGAFFTTSAIALGTNNRLLQSQFRDLAPINILQRYFVNVMDCSCFWWSTLSHSAAKHATATAEDRSAAEELGEKIFSIHATPARTALEAFLSILIIDLALLWIGKNFICVRDLLELLGSIRAVCILI